MKARTVAFISLVFSENVRAYISRSFEKPIWVNMCSNWEMQKAILVAQLCLIIAVFVPGFNDKVLGLDGVAVGLWGWGVALAGPIGCVILCEAYKVFTGIQLKQYQRKLKATQEAEDERSRQALSTQTPTKDPDQKVPVGLEHVSLDLSK